MSIRVPKKPSDAYQHGNLRPALIQAGLRLLSEGGVQNLTLRAAAQLAGVSHTAPYRHFADKDALVAAIAEEGFRLLAARLRDHVAACDSAKVTDRLREMAVGYVSFGLEHPAYLRVIFGGVVDKTHIPPGLKAAGDEAYGVLRNLVAEGVESGELRAGDPDELALACWSMTHGLAMLIVDRALPPPLCDVAPAEAMTRTISTFLRDGIARRSRT